MSRKAQFKIKVPKTAIVIIKLWIALFALSNQALTLLDWDYLGEYPLMRVLFGIFENVDGWGMEMIFMAVGLGTVFYIVQGKDRQSTKWLSIISAIFALCTIFGKSYAETQSWDYIFRGKIQLMLALFVMAGFYFIYKNLLLFLGWVLEQKQELLRSEAKGKLEKWILADYPFWGPFLVLLVCGLPWLICYWPGTLQWDAHAQLWQALGVQELTGHHPVFVTKLMGGCMELGRVLFSSDEAGLFLYTFPQFIIQCLIFSYGIYLATRMRTPILLRWGMLLFYGMFPLLPIWGFTEVKDTGYYLFVLLFVLVMTDVLWCNEKKIGTSKWILWIVAVMGIGLFRNDGRYLVLGTLVLAVVLVRRYWKMYLLGALACLAAVFLVEKVYMPMEDISKGSVREALCIPMLQTALYLGEHGDELTPEESEVLQNIFGEDLNKVVESYHPENADGVKELFAKNPSDEELTAYFKVWWRQLLKHPDTYIQAFLNHAYGYLYPERRNVAGTIWIFEIGNSDHWQDGYLDIAFGMENAAGRKFLETFTLWMYQMPVVGMFFGTGIYHFILLGCIGYLLSKKSEYTIVLIPCLFTLAICMMSPISACVRYALPNIVVMPFALAWCSAVNKRSVEEEENTNERTEQLKINIA